MGRPADAGLFAVAIHPGRVGTQAELRGGKRLDAFLDDACLTCDPGRVRTPTLISIWARPVSENPVVFSPETTMGHGQKHETFKMTNKRDAYIMP